MASLTRVHTTVRCVVRVLRPATTTVARQLPAATVMMSACSYSSWSGSTSTHSRVANHIVGNSGTPTMRRPQGLPRHVAGNQQRRTKFTTSRLVDFTQNLQAAAEALNKDVSNPLAGPNQVWSTDNDSSSARPEYLPFYAFDVHTDVVFQGKLADGTSTGKFRYRSMRFMAEADSPENNGDVDMLVYAAYTYRRKYVQAAKVRSLAASEPWNIAAASPSLGRHATSHPLDHRGPPDLDPFAMSQQFAWDMVQERILRAMVEPARTTLMQETGSNYVKDVHVALTIKQRRCVPVYLPAYIFEYRYLGLPWRAIVGGTTLAVGGETHRSPFKIAGMVLVAGIVTKMPLPILPAALASGAAVALWPAVQKFIKGMERRAERSRDKSSSSSKSWYDWERSGEWGQWHQERWSERERQHRAREAEEEARADQRWGRHGGTSTTGAVPSTSLYATLGLTGQERSATTEDVQRAFRRLALKYHPDVVRSKGEEEKRYANERFREILQAYKVLRNPSKRAKYDRTGQYQH